MMSQEQHGWAPLASSSMVPTSITGTGECNRLVWLHIAQSNTEPTWGYGACRALEGYFPLKTAAHFLTKVTLNQVLLAPVVLVVVFSWNLALQGQAKEIPAKIRRDFVPSLMNGEWRRVVVVIAELRCNSPGLYALAA